MIHIELGKLDKSALGRYRSSFGPILGPIMGPLGPIWSNLRALWALIVRVVLGNITKCLILGIFPKNKLFRKKVKFFSLKNFNTQSLTFCEFAKSHFSYTVSVFEKFSNFLRYLPTKFAKNFKSETVY